MSEYLKRINTAAALINALGVVGARVRELENKAPDMTSYQMFTEMNNVVSYQAEQIAELQEQLKAHQDFMLKTAAKYGLITPPTDKSKN